jgi:Family of unknown function (DUF6502)
MTILEDLRVYHRFYIYLSSIHLQKMALNVHLAHLKWRLGNQNIMHTETNFNFSSSVLSQEQALLEAAIDKVLQPMANLWLAKGLSIQALEERMRTAFVQSAVASLGSQQPQRMNSRISASTGLTRREVARIQAQSEVPAQLHSKIRPSSATEIFTRWVSDAAFCDVDGQPMVLPRLADESDAPDTASFERLAQSVTQDVHPRSLLDELCRLGLAAWDVDADTVELLKTAFVPRGDWSRMTSFLGDNLGDHMRAASANVLGSGKEHMDQAIFADELSVQSLQAFRDMMAEHWKRTLTDLVPKLEKMISDDKEAGRIQNQRVRIGLYTWSQPMSGPIRSLRLVSNQTKSAT